MTRPPPRDPVDRLFADALEVDPDQRLGFLLDASRTDPKLAREVLLLLEESERVPEFRGPGRRLLRAALVELLGGPPP